jgi:hypothetical protein
MTALKLNPERDVASPDQIIALLGQHDYLQVDLPAAAGSQRDANLIGAIRSIHGAQARSLIALGSPRGTAPAASARAQALQRDGFPNLGVFGADLQSAADLAALRQTLSLRARPAQAGEP